MGKIRLFISGSKIRHAGRLSLRILFFAPLLLMVGVVNVCVDPAGVYKKAVNPYDSDEYRIGMVLAGGNKAVIDRPMDHRILEKCFIENLTASPDIVVLGSSRSLWVGDNIFPNKKVVNNFITDAVLADYLGIFEEYAKKNILPHRVILFLDPQLTLYPVYSEGWISIKEDTYGMLNRLGIHSERIKEPMIPRAWRNLFSFSYFQESINKLLGRRIHEAYHESQGNHDKQFLLQDGRYMGSVLTQNNEDRIRAVIKRFYNGLYAQVSTRQANPDKDLALTLEGFIRYLLEHHIKVTLYLLPFQAQVYQSFLELEKIPGAFDIVGLEGYHRRLAQRLNVEIAGSYDPAVCHLSDKDFYDGEHIKNDVIEKMFKQKGFLCSMPDL